MRARVIRDLPPLLTEAEAWSACVAASVDCVGDAGERRFPAASMRLFLDGCQDESPCSPLLPTASDGDFGAYTTRVLGATGLRCSLNISHFHTLAWDVYDRVRRALAGFGYGNGRRPVYVGLFCGSDAMSAVGAHLDSDYDELFQYVVAGRKRAFLWESGALDPDVRARLTNTSIIEPYVDRATVLEMDTGEVLNWPGSCYHIMENLEQYSVSLTVGIRSAAVAYAQTDLFEVLREVVEGHTRGLGDPATWHGALAAAIPDAEAVHRGLRAKRLAALSASGLYNSPPLFTNPIMLDTPIYYRPGGSLYWEPQESGVLVACCGYTRALDLDPLAFEALLRAIPRARSSAATPAALCESIGARSANALERTLAVLRVLSQIGAVSHSY